MTPEGTMVCGKKRPNGKAFPKQRQKVDKSSCLPLNRKRNDDGSCFYLQYMVEAYRKRVKRSRLDLPGWKCGQGIWVKCPPGICCESLLAAAHLSREWLQGNSWLTTADVSRTTFLFWDGRLRCFWIRLQSFQKFSLLKGQQRHRTGLKRALNIWLLGKQ